MNAARDIYPLSSSSDSRVNNSIICGRNEITEPTPAIIPSITRLCAHSDAFTETRNDCNPPPSKSVMRYVAPSRKSVPGAPKVTANTISITIKKNGSAKNLFVTTLSILSDTLK